MGAPYMWIGIWDPDMDDATMLEKCGDSLRRAGARVRTERGASGGLSVEVSRYDAFAEPGEVVGITASRSVEGSGGLVEFVVSWEYFDTGGRVAAPLAWARFREALAQLIADVRPLIVVCPVECAVDELPDPPAEAAYDLFQTGWVDPTRLAPSQRSAFARVLEGGPRSELVGGWWWSDYAPLDPGGRGSDDSEALSQALYEAWTGRGVVGRGVPTADLDLPLALTEVWLWSSERNERELLRETADWAASKNVDVEGIAVGPNGEPGFFPITVELEAGDKRGIELVRRMASDLRASWVAFMPESGLAVPGLTPDIPSTGVLFNFWVADAWIGVDALGELDDILAGAHRETLADGTLFVTDPSTLPDGRFADWCRDPAARWDRLVDAAAVLARHAGAT